MLDSNSPIAARGRDCPNQFPLSFPTERRYFQPSNEPANSSQIHPQPMCSRLQEGRRTYVLHVVFSEQLHRILCVNVRIRGVAKVLLHLSRGRKCNEHMARRLAYRRERVRNHPRSENRFTRMQFQSLLTHLKRNLALHNVEQLLLVEMLVQRRPARHQVDMLHQEQPAARLARHHLEQQGTEPHCMRMPEPVFTLAHKVHLASARWRLRSDKWLARQNVMQAKDRHSCCCGPQKGTTAHRDSSLQMGMTR